MGSVYNYFCFFFFNDPATTELYPLSLHDALPIYSDRFDAGLGRRMSFEERVMRCYAGHMDGFVPTLYDPAVRDIRILARAVVERGHEPVHVARIDRKSTRLNSSH